MTSSQSAGSISRNGPTSVRPALLTRPSMRPKRSMTALDQALGLRAVADVGRERVGSRRRGARARATTPSAALADRW